MVQWLRSPGSSAGKEYTCNAGDSGLIPGLGRSAGEVRIPTPVFLGFSCGSAGKESACNAGDLSLIFGSVRFPTEQNGYPLQYSGQENSRDCTVHGSQRTDMTERLSLSLFSAEDADLIPCLGN